MIILIPSSYSRALPGTIRAARCMMTSVAEKSLRGGPEVRRNRSRTVITVVVADHPRLTPCASLVLQTCSANLFCQTCSAKDEWSGPPRCRRRTCRSSPFYLNRGTERSRSQPIVINSTSSANNAPNRGNTSKTGINRILWRIGIPPASRHSVTIRSAHSTNETKTVWMQCKLLHPASPPLCGSH